MKIYRKRATLQNIPYLEASFAMNEIMFYPLRIRIEFMFIRPFFRTMAEAIEQQN